MKAVSESWDEDKKHRIYPVIESIEFHSSENSDSDDPDLFKIQTLSWEGEELSKLKQELDNHYQEQATPKAKKMRTKREREYRANQKKHL